MFENMDKDSKINRPTLWQVVRLKSGNWIVVSEHETFSECEIAYDVLKHRKTIWQTLLPFLFPVKHYKIRKIGDDIKSSSARRSTWNNQ